GRSDLLIPRTDFLHREKGRGWSLAQGRSIPHVSVARPTPCATDAARVVSLAGETRDDRRQRVEVRLVDGVVGNPPARPPGLELLDEPVDRADQHVGALQDVVDAQLTP